MAGVKRNFLYNLILVMGNYLFPLLVFPYVSRVLGVEKIGVCNWIDSIVDFFVLFSTLGVGMLGVREIARVKDNREKMNQVYSSLLFFNAGLSVVACTALVCATYLFISLAPYKEFLLIGVSKLLFSAFLVEWFFQGISQFKYITIRALIIRCCYVASVFLFVRDSGDAGIYYLLICLSVVANAIVNLTYSRQFVTFALSKVKMGLFIVPIISFGVYKILTSMYVNFNVLFLGSVTDDVQVGYYATATKLYGIILSAITAFTTVMVPKVSEMLQRGELEELKRIAYKVFDVIFSLSIPVIVLSLFYAPLIIGIIAGPGYEGAIVPFRIVMLLLFIVSVEQVLVMQFLLALKNSRCVLALCIVGALVGVTSNVLLVPGLKSVGSAISWLLSEIAVLSLASYFFQKHFDIAFPMRSLVRNLVNSIPYILVCLVCSRYLNSCFITLAVALMAVWFILSQVYYIRSEVILDYFGIIKRKLL